MWLHFFITFVKLFLGAIDLIVVEQPDGTYRSTPFHVRFGKYGVLNSNEKYVDITINGEEIDLKMKLGENGVAFFVEKASVEDNVPEYLATSPIPGTSPEPDVEALLEASANELRNQQRGRSEQKRVISECSSISRSPSPVGEGLVNRQNENSLKAKEKLLSEKGLIFNPLLYGGRQNHSLPNLTELEQDKDGISKSDTSLKSSKRHFVKLKHSSSYGKISSSSYASQRETQVWKKRYLSETKFRDRQSHESDNEDIASSTSSLASSGLSSMGEESSHAPSNIKNIVDGAFSDSEVERQRNSLQPRGNDVTEWKWGELPKTRKQTESAKKAHSERVHVAAKETEAKSSWSGWFRWSRPKPNEDQGIYLDDLVESSANDPGKIEMYLGTPISSCPSPPYDSGNASTTSPFFGSYNDSDLTGRESFSNSHSSVSTDRKVESLTPVIDATDNVSPLESAAVEEDDLLSKTIVSTNTDGVADSSYKQRGAEVVVYYGKENEEKDFGPEVIYITLARGKIVVVFRSATENDADTTIITETDMNQTKEKHIYKRSLRLSSEKLKKLGLRRGANEARFSITTKFQGTSLCTCHIYLYKWYDQLVISDIDGTITKSDVLGHVIPAVGGQWAHAGVAELYTRIKENGYRMVYLSSRAVGQSYYTKRYLQSVAQDSMVLPDGPLLLSPTSVLVAFRREVIDRKPEEFKIAALSDLKECFPVKKPFYAGFGNRATDVVSYRAVDIPPERIMIIDRTGRVRRADEIGYESSYVSIAMDTVDYIFPPLLKHRKSGQRPFNDDEWSVGMRNDYSFSKPQTCRYFFHIF
uniref:LNS2 domain-containing protein n=1 Tax=Syphacia muris TaxID=451379 RepID=A0A0N5AHA1_9BILA